jgi:hypothetical protein
MFATTQIPALNLGFPDVCLTPIAPPVPVPIPYPNLALSALGVPAAYTVLFSAAPAHFLATTIVMSLGDCPGIALGVASGMVMGPARNLTAAFTILVWGIPATRLTSISLQNLTNCPGMTITPSQVKVLLLGA